MHALSTSFMEQWPSTAASSKNGDGHHWGIILAGGEGARLRPTIERWLGEPRPKQYCTFVGTRSMLQHTVDRACRLVDRDHIITVIGQGHRRFLDQSLAFVDSGRTIEQPCARGNGIAVVVATACILAADPAATVLVFPSDHFAFPEDQFLAHALRAGLLAESLEDRLVLLGAIPEAPETDYGWIETGNPLTADWTAFDPPRQVVAFAEKPGAAEAGHFFRRGCLCNTMVLAAKARFLWCLAEQFLPEIMPALEIFRRDHAFSRMDSEEWRRIYEGLESIDLCRDLLQRIPNSTVVVPLKGILWSDWGRPERIQDSLRRLGRRASFSGETAA